MVVTLRYRSKLNIWRFRVPNVNRSTKNQPRKVMDLTINPKRSWSLLRFQEESVFGWNSFYLDSFILKNQHVTSKSFIFHLVSAWDSFYVLPETSAAEVCFPHRFGAAFCKPRGCCLGLTSSPTPVFCLSLSAIRKNASAAEHKSFFFLMFFGGIKMGGTYLWIPKICAYKQNVPKKR